MQSCDLQYISGPSNCRLYDLRSVVPLHIWNQLQHYAFIFDRISCLIRTLAVVLLDSACAERYFYVLHSLGGYESRFQNCGAVKTFEMIR